MSTRLIVVVLRGSGCDRLMHRLLDADLRVTEFSSTGGFLRRKSTTLIIGAPADRVDTALALIREMCATPPGADEHNATIFVLRATQCTVI